MHLADGSGISTSFFVFFFPEHSGRVIFNIKK